MRKLKVGDIVRLNSGGPLMTVTETSNDRSSTDVAWFEADEFQSTNMLPEKCLVFVERPNDKQ